MFYRLVNETRSIALVQAGTQANQIVKTIDRAGNIINFPENHADKNFLFSEDSKETVLKFLYHKKSKTMNRIKHSITTIYM